MLIVGTRAFSAGFPRSARNPAVVLGKRETVRGLEWMLASEQRRARTLAGFSLVRDVGPGEAIFIDMQGRMHAAQCTPALEHTPCIFEYVYFARPDSIIDNISVHKARMRMGERLAEKIERLRPDHDIDVVIPIPDTSRTSALQLALALGVKYREGFVKNRYIGRTFIMPGQEQRARSVRSKLNVIDLEFRGKNVLRSMSRSSGGTTSAKISELARAAGARKCISLPQRPVRFPNVYGSTWRRRRARANGRKRMTSRIHRGGTAITGLEEHRRSLPPRNARIAVRHVLLIGRYVTAMYRAF